MKTILGHSDDPDTLEAIAEAIEQCKRELAPGERPVAALLFASTEYEHGPLLERIASCWPGLPVIGGTTDGEMSSSLGFCHDSLMLMLFAGNDLSALAGLSLDLSTDPEAAVDRALAELGDRRPALCLTTFAPTTDSTRVVNRLQARLEGCPIVGGLTGDHREFARSQEFFADGVHSDSLPVLLLFGDIHASFGVASGWFPIGDSRTVTRSEGNVVYEIDGVPALEIYGRHYGTVPTQSLGEYPLAVEGESTEGRSAWNLRAILDSDRATGALRFAGDVPQGARVRMTEVLADGIRSGSRASLEEALSRYPGTSPKCLLIFSCAARKWVLGTSAESELSDLRDCAASHGHEDLAIAGAYCFGEIAPPLPGQRSAFHNETCVTVLLGS